MIKYITGNILESDADVLVNPVNTKGVMGAGLALQFKRIYPGMFDSYASACRNGSLRIGQIHIWQAPSGKIVINFPTKIDWRNPSKNEYIEKGLRALRAYLLENPRSCAVPPLGCGLGGLEWLEVKTLIEDGLNGIDSKVYVYGP